MRIKKEKAVIGLSLSYCVQDIATGRVSLGEVAYIETGTMIRSEEDWEAVIERYSQSYWVGIEAKAKLVVDALRRLDLIQQPRLLGCSAPNISKGHWILDQNCWEY